MADPEPGVELPPAGRRPLRHLPVAVPPGGRLHPARPQSRAHIPRGASPGQLGGQVAALQGGAGAAVRPDAAAESSAKCDV